MLKLKSLTLKTNVVQSPMAACTDLPYRLVSRDHGMEFGFLEMVSAESLVRGNEKTGEIMRTVPEDKPLGAQLVGCNPDSMGEAAGLVEALGYDLLDLNLGCPVPKIHGNGAGSALLAKPDLARKIFTRVVKAVKKIPVTVKMRKGVNDTTAREAVTIAKIAEDCGLSAVAIHGRTRAQGYSGAADYEAIRKVKEAVKIPVIGNGDVTCAADAKRMREVSGCDAVMVGRGGLGNPWIFKHIQQAIEGRVTDTVEPTLEEKKKVLLKHMELELTYRPQRIAIFHMRRIANWYFKNYPGVAAFRGKINVCDSVDEMRELILNFK